ncbi:MAG: nucleoside phosphorylase [Halarsenatibacteraceae bacterium]
MSEEMLPILKTTSNNINKKVIVCGDPGRVDKIAKYLDRVKEIAYNREYKLINGSYNDQMVSVVSHGVGAAGAAVCFEEIIKGGAEEIIRIGTAGSLNLSIEDGDIVIAEAAIREDGLTEQLIDKEFPAVADLDLTRSLITAASELSDNQVQSGIILTVGAFYPEIEPLPNNYYSKAGALAVEMEASVLFLIASLHGVAAGGIFAIDGIAVDFDADSYNPHRDKVDQAIDNSIKIALEAITL